MKRFKVLATFLIALTFIFSLAACGGQNNGSSDNTGADSNASGDSSDSDNSDEGQFADFPDHKVTFVYHSEAGSGGDFFLRTLAKPLEDIWGVPVVVENLTGAGGAEATRRVVEAKPDGYTLLGTSSTIISAHIIGNFKHSYKDLTPIAQVLADPQIVYVKGDSQFDDLKDLIDYEKKNPGKLSWGRSTPGSGDSVALAKLSKATGIDPKEVAFSGGSEVLTNILGGHIDVAFGEPGELQGQVKAGKIKVLASLTDERLEQYEDVPTAKELGWDITVMRPRGIMGPADMPKGLQDKIVDALKQVYDYPKFKEYYTKNGIAKSFKPEDEFKKVYDDLDQNLSQLLK